MSANGDTRTNPEDYFSWSEEYAVGVTLIDDDHRQLFETVNELHAEIERTPSPQTMREITNRLTRYAQEHFEREEHLMAEYNYPKLVEHRQKHHEFIRMVHAIRKIELERPGRLDPQRLLVFLEGWLRRHILQADRDYVPALHGGYGRRKSDITTPLDAAPKTDDKHRGELATVPVQVPFSAVNVIRRCARLLRLGEDAAKAIEEITDPISGMTIDDALAISELVLRREEKR